MGLGPGLAMVWLAMMRVVPPEILDEQHRRVGLVGQGERLAVGHGALEIGRAGGR